MNIDEKIKRELEQSQQEFDEVIQEQEGLMKMVFGSFHGGMKRWVFAVYFFTLVASGFMLWTGYRFFTALDMQGQIFWGVCLILSLFAQVALKQWIWMEMNRASIMREMKRLEVAVSRLSACLDTK